MTGNRSWWAEFVQALAGDYPHNCSFRRELEVVQKLLADKETELDRVRSELADEEAVHEPMRAKLARLWTMCDENEAHIRTAVPHLPPDGGTFSVHQIRQVLRGETPCKKCGSVGCAEDAASGWYDFPDPP